MNQTYVDNKAYEWEGFYTYKETKFPFHPWGDIINLAFHNLKIEIVYH
jgi:hypothetical protein